MTVEEIKAKLPEAELYTLSSDCKYLLVVRKHVVSKESIQKMCEVFKQQHLDVMVVSVATEVDDALRLLEVK